MQERIYESSALITLFFHAGMEKRQFVYYVCHTLTFDNTEMHFLSFYSCFEEISMKNDTFV